LGKDATKNRISQEFKIGTLMILGIVLLVTGLNYLKGFNPMSKQIHLYAVYERIEGLAVSNPVLVNGFKVGQVTNVGFSDKGDGSLLVEFTIEESNLKVPIDSDAKIFSSDLFGTKSIKIEPGITENYIQDGDTLVSSVEMDITETVRKELEPLRRKTEELIKGVDDILLNMKAVFEDDATQGLPSAFESMQRTLRTLENTAENLDGLVEENRVIFTRVMTNVDALALNLSNNNRKIANIISNFSDLSDSLVTVDISNTMAKADKAIDEIAMMTSRINNGEGTLGQLMVNDSLYNGLVESNVEIQELLDDLQLNPWKYVRVSLFGRKQDAKMSKGDIKRMEKMIREEMEKQQ
jgi:phospholipid/cholesterol/gamma-HCH transport system substrate-binding protein|tara:strand:- start:3435 stop:4490 length:1056 start_codon:yes stop_codon:yes gene_type:complete